MRRHTINDIARHAGVSKSAVSFALNGRPGVSDSTRQRILAVAAELGWRPDSSARALSAARVDMVGFVLARNPALLAVEPYFMQFIAGVESELGPRQIGLALQMVGDQQGRELEVYRRWWSQHSVDGVFLADLHTDDPRIPLFTELGLPAVMLSRPAPGVGLPSVWVDVRPAMREALRYLFELGHRRIARVTGVSGFVHTKERTSAYRSAAKKLGFTSAVCVEADYTGDEGARATRALLDSASPPTAIIYDNDVMAVSAIGVAHELGVRIPAELSIIAWDDSALCRLPHPSLTAMRLDVQGFGAAAAKALVETISGQPPTSVRFGTLSLVERGSTGPAPTARG